MVRKMITNTLMTGGLLHIAMLIQMLKDIRGQAVEALSLVGKMMLIRMQKFAIRGQVEEERMIREEGRLTVETSSSALLKRIPLILTLEI